jgi:hypothetical protein
VTALPITMTTDEAERITAGIKKLFDSAAEHLEKVVSLIEQAEAGQAWRALKYPSWTAYVEKEFSGSVARLARAQRTPVVQKLSATGMSTRAIASVVGVSKSQVADDVSSSGHLIPTNNVVGIDGKRYSRSANQQDFEGAVNKQFPATYKPRRKPLTEEYRYAMHDLQKAVERLERLHADDRFPGLRKQLAEIAPVMFTAELAFKVNDMGAQLHHRRYPQQAKP